MLYLYTGTPGSGKSLHAMQRIIANLRFGRNVITSFPIDIDYIKSKYKPVKGKKFGLYVFKPIVDITPQFLYQFSKKYHEKGKEGQTVVFLDECQIIFNPRDYRDNDRKSWLQFFPVHRHLGFDFFLITQQDRFIDRQIRALVEYEVKHRKLNNYKFAAFLPFKWFIAIKYWYGVRQKVEQEFFIYKKYMSKCYDSYTMFDEVLFK